MVDFCFCFCLFLNFSNFFYSRILLVFFFCFKLNTDDLDESWIIDTEEKLLDEFDDVDPHEKLFMKMWNRHVRKYKIYADHNVS